MRVSHVITRLIVGGAQENTMASVLGLQRVPGWKVNLLSGPTRGPEGTLENDFIGEGSHGIPGAFWPGCNSRMIEIGN